MTVIDRAEQDRERSPGLFYTPPPGSPSHRQIEHDVDEVLGFIEQRSQEPRSVHSTQPYFQEDDHDDLYCDPSPPRQAPSKRAAVSRLDDDEDHNRPIGSDDFPASADLLQGTKSLLLGLDDSQLPVAPGFGNATSTRQMRWAPGRSDGTQMPERRTSNIAIYQATQPPSSSFPPLTVAKPLSSTSPAQPSGKPKRRRPAYISSSEDDGLLLAEPPKKPRKKNQKLTGIEDNTTPTQEQNWSPQPSNRIDQDQPAEVLRETIVESAMQQPNPDRPFHNAIDSSFPSGQESRDAQPGTTQPLQNHSQQAQELGDTHQPGSNDAKQAQANKRASIQREGSGSAASGSTAQLHAEIMAVFEKQDPDHSEGEAQEVHQHTHNTEEEDERGDEIEDSPSDPGYSEVESDEDAEAFRNSAHRAGTADLPAAEMYENDPEWEELLRTENRILRLRREVQARRSYVPMDDEEYLDATDVEHGNGRTK